jgi:DNA-binding NtrC family response regulator
MSIALGAALQYDARTPGIIGTSAPIRRLRELIERVGHTSLSVLIQGPSGSGKELVAAALHTASGRSGAFVPFNVCAISDAMFEDALFGHVRGAFTGALNDMPGFLREAHGGTVFLDEISGLPLSAQAKLLRAIETGVFRPVGAKRDTQSDFRVVAATNEAMDRLVDGGRFRGDLAHRLAGMVLIVPALVDRLDDLPELTAHFLGRLGVSTRVDDESLRLLATHDWPGNVRELKHVVECAFAFSEGHFHPESVRAALSQRRSTTAAMSISALSAERLHLQRIMAQYDWDHAAAAEALGIHRATLYRRMRRLGVSGRR